MTQDRNRWKGFVIGMASSMAALGAMRLYWRYVAPRLRESIDPDSSSANPDDDSGDVSISGEGNDTADVVGLTLYRVGTGHEPESEETRALLSQIVQWGYGMVQGGIYGAWNAGKESPSLLRTGPVVASGLWMLGDEVVAPLLGLKRGPSETTPAGHLNRLIGQLAYGFALASTTRVLNRIL